MDRHGRHDGVAREALVGVFFCEKRGPPIQGICADVVYLIRIKFCPSSRLLFSPAESASKLVRIIMFEMYKCGEHLDYYDASPADTTEALMTSCSCESCTCGGGTVRARQAKVLSALLVLGTLPPRVCAHGAMVIDFIFPRLSVALCRVGRGAE